jgi:hypothetical protein
MKLICVEGIAVKRGTLRKVTENDDKREIETVGCPGQSAGISFNWFFFISR